MLGNVFKMSQQGAQTKLRNSALLVVRNIDIPSSKDQPPTHHQQPSARLQASEAIGELGAIIRRDPGSEQRQFFYLLHTGHSFFLDSFFLFDFSW